MARGTVPTANYLGRKSLRTVVILAEKAMYPILASPTTEPGRRGWSWQRGSPTSALSLCLKVRFHNKHPFLFIIQRSAATKDPFRRHEHLLQYVFPLCPSVFSVVSCFPHLISKPLHS